MHEAPIDLAACGVTSLLPLVFLGGSIILGRVDCVAPIGAFCSNPSCTDFLDDPPCEESDLHEYLAERLCAAGAEAEVWEPTTEDVAESRLVPHGLRFDGRPQMAARFPGAGDGWSLRFNGHIDVVPAGSRQEWTSDSFQAQVREGNLYGRGAVDMKGGIATMVFAAEALASLDLRLAGDLVVCTVTDEESTGAGGVAAVNLLEVTPLPQSLPTTKPGAPGSCAGAYLPGLSASQSEV